MKKELLSVRDAAILANVHYNTIRNWIRHGLLTRYGVGKVTGSTKFNRTYKVEKEQVLSIMRGD